MPYTICVLGNTQQHACFWLNELALHNQSQVLLNLGDELILRDGTVLMAHSMTQDLSGCRFDEVFLAPAILGETAPLKYDILERNMAGSSIPPEFRWHYISQWEEYR